MRKVMMCLNGIKSVCLMLLAYLTLSVAATSCNQDEFENYEPEKKREFTKAELIEQALSRMPQTRSGNATVMMVSLKDTIEFRCEVTENMVLYWDEEETASIVPGVNSLYQYGFTDNYPSHVITISGSDEAIRRLEVDNNGLIFLNVSYNSKLSTLHCANNHLDEITLKGCPRLSELNISNNEFTDIDLTVLSLLGSLEADNNWLTELDLSTNPYLMQLSVENNKLKALDLSDKSMLLILMAKNNSLKQLDLTSNTNLMYLDISSTWLTDLNMRPGVSVILCE
ncbi:MAG: hypothetical protein K2L23_06700, partial [Odoribacter sp.]|nr:hypothetical protein [Odoribacter sp.]